MRAKLVDILDELPNRQSSTRWARSVSTLEKLVAEAFANDQGLEIIKLQDDPVSSIATRLSLHIIYTYEPLFTPLSSPTREEQETWLTGIVSALNILRGMALVHINSKILLGREIFIRRLLEILVLCRQPLQTATNVPAKPPLSPDRVQVFKTPVIFPELALGVIDTLLCVLVDSPKAIRTFEKLDGVEAIVKVLKKAEGLRDVRIKCLEFLYFYLLPEDGSVLQVQSAPLTPARTSTPFAQRMHGPREDAAPPVPGINFKHLLTAQHSTTNSPFSTPPISPSKHSSHDNFSKPQTPGNRSYPPQRASNAAPIPKPIFIPPASPTRRNVVTSYSSTSSSSKAPSSSSSAYSANTTTTLGPNTFSRASGSSSARRTPSSSSSNLKSSATMGMLRRDVEYIPISPKKKQVMNLGVGKPSTSSSTLTFGLRAPDADDGNKDGPEENSVSGGNGDRREDAAPSGGNISTLGPSLALSSVMTEDASILEWTLPRTAGVVISDILTNMDRVTNSASPTKAGEAGGSGDHRLDISRPSTFAPPRSAGTAILISNVAKPQTWMMMPLNENRSAVPISSSASSDEMWKAVSRGTSLFLSDQSTSKDAHSTLDLDGASAVGDTKIQVFGKDAIAVASLGDTFAVVQPKTPTSRRFKTPRTSPSRPTPSFTSADDDEENENTPQTPTRPRSSRSPPSAFSTSPTKNTHFGKSMSLLSTVPSFTQAPRSPSNPPTKSKLLTPRKSHHSPTKTKSKSSFLPQTAPPHRTSGFDLGIDGEQASGMPSSNSDPTNLASESAIGGMIRTTEEKKILLGAWLGNVDALVEGVQKAGVWAL